MTSGWTSSAWGTTTVTTHTQSCVSRCLSFWGLLWVTTVLNHRDDRLETQWRHTQLLTLIWLHQTYSVRFSKGMCPVVQSYYVCALLRQCAFDLGLVWWVFCFFFVITLLCVRICSWIQSKRHCRLKHTFSHSISVFSLQATSRPGPGFSCHGEHGIMKAHLPLQLRAMLVSDWLRSPAWVGDVCCQLSNRAQCTLGLLLGGVSWKEVSWILSLSFCLSLLCPHWLHSPSLSPLSSLFLHFYTYRAHVRKFTEYFMLLFGAFVSEIVCVCVCALWKVCFLYIVCAYCLWYMHTGRVPLLCASCMCLWVNVRQKIKVGAFVSFGGGHIGVHIGYAQGVT